MVYNAAGSQMCWPRRIPAEDMAHCMF